MDVGHEEGHIARPAHCDPLPDPFDPGVGVSRGQRPAILDRTQRSEQREPVPLRDL